MSKARIRPGIYAIYNAVNEMIYIGQSKSLDYRLVNHASRLKLNKHHNAKLQAAYNKQQGEGFVFRAIELCDMDQLNDREIYWIGLYDSTNRDRGYNLQYGGDAVSALTDEHKAAIGAGNRGRIIGPEARARMKAGQANRQAALLGIHVGEYLEKIAYYGIRWKNLSYAQKQGPMIPRKEQPRKELKPILSKEQKMARRKALYASPEYRERLKEGRRNSAIANNPEWRKRISDKMKKYHDGK
jgi:group I intron endonuclease